MNLDRSTIVAVATAPGRGGIGVVRLSGEKAREISAAMLQLQQPMEAGRALFGYLLDQQGPQELGKQPVLDEVVVTYFAGPRSYTGEDVVEISAHGSPVLLDAILRGCMQGGARLAEPGEFTQRALLSGRLDLTQAEAVNDLIQSSTLHQARTAAGQLGGSLSRQIAPLKELLLRLIANIEAGIDFAEDDIDVLPSGEILEWIADVVVPLEDLERSFAYGRVVRDGFKLAIVGRPNAGKSSLFNALVERERAIVTAAPGTTRDTVAETIALEGVPVELVDTAGLRGEHSTNKCLEEAEVLGISRSRQAMADADVVLLVVDGTIGFQEEDIGILGQEEVEREVESRGRLLVAWNKSDLFAAEEGGRKVVSRRVQLVETSARSGAGLHKLRRAILTVVRGGEATREGGMLTNLRQHRAVAQTLTALNKARVAATSALPHELLVMDLKQALHQLDELTGTTTPEDVLRLIFSTFCIGK